jgi:hypothetical protein
LVVPKTSWFVAAPAVKVLVTFSDVPVAAPMFGVVNVGLVANTSEPDPCSSEITPASSDEVVDESTLNLSVVTTRVFDAGMVVLLILVAVAAPNDGVTRLGDMENTTDPAVPVSSDMSDASCADVVGEN